MQILSFDKGPTLTGLPPIIDDGIEVLILGSFPGGASLAARQYYAHPRNQFWRLLSAILNDNLAALPYAKRLPRLLRHRIGLWDVIAGCDRLGSLDSAIRNPHANDFDVLRNQCPRLRRVCFNGKTSGSRAPWFEAAGYDTLVLPSSSPANAQWSFERKLAAWRGIIDNPPRRNHAHTTLTILLLMLIRRKSIEADANLIDGPRRRKTTGEDARSPRRPRYAPVTLSEEDGVRYLHFGTEWVQGAMRLRKPEWLELEYAQQMMAWMLFIESPAHIVQLGLGSAALTKFSHANFPEARITAVELNPSVIAICRTMFRLPANDERLNVIEADAMDYVIDPFHRGTVDALQVDLYDATARGPVLDTPAFYRACATTLAPHGIMTINLFGDHPSYEKNLDAMRPFFSAVICLPEVHDGNVIAIAFKIAPVLEFKRLYERAAQIADQTRLPAASWVNGLKAGLAR